MPLVSGNMDVEELETFLVNSVPAALNLEDRTHMLRSELSRQESRQHLLDFVSGKSDRCATLHIQWENDSFKTSHEVVCSNSTAHNVSYLCTMLAT